MKSRYCSAKNLGRPCSTRETEDTFLIISGSFQRSNYLVTADINTVNLWCKQHHTGYLVNMVKGKDESELSQLALNTYYSEVDTYIIVTNAWTFVWLLRVRVSVF